MSNEEEVLQRFECRFFETTENPDTGTHLVDRGTLSYRSVLCSIDMIKSKKLPPGKGEFLPGSVRTMDGEEIWNFVRENVASGLGRLVFLEDDVVIAVVRQDNEKISIVRSVKAMLDRKKRSMEEVVRAKRAVAKKLNRHVEFTGSEERWIEQKVQQQRAKIQAQLEKKGGKKARRTERRDALLRRGHIFVWTKQDERLRHGIPCTATEYPSLPDDEFAILVEWYDDESGKHGPVQTAFRVKKTGGGRTEKFKEVTVTDIAPGQKKAANKPRVIRVLTCSLPSKDGEVPQPVYCFQDMEAIHRARARGLNGGTYATFDVPNEKGRYQIYSLKDSGIETVCERAPT